VNGVVCRSCLVTSYPARGRCPVCGGGEVSVVALAPAGTVAARTTVGPLQIGEVRLDDGVLVLGRLDADAPVAVGARVRHAPDDAIVRFVADA
jgi:uncharacterized OB-fold protein